MNWRVLSVPRCLRKWAGKGRRFLAFLAIYMASRNPTRPVGAPRSLDPDRIGNEAPRFGVPGSETLIGYADLVKFQLSNTRLNALNTGYPDGPGTKPSFVISSQLLTVMDPPTGFKFRIVMRVRGVMERCGFISGTPLTGGYVLQNGSDTTNGNILEVHIDDSINPAVDYWCNYKAGAAVINPIESFDFTFTFDLENGADITFSLSGSTPPRQRDNTTELVVGPVGLTPYPSVYAGQFAQFDVSSCTLVAV